MVEGDDIASGENLRDAGLHEVVDAETVLDLDPGRCTEFDVGDDANADDGNVGRDAGAGGGGDGDD